MASLGSLSSDDTVSSTNHPTNAMQLFNPSTVSTNVVAPDRISVLMNKSQMHLLKPHTTTLTTSKQAYTCGHCSGLGHTRSHCPIILSGNQRVMPAKTLVPGDFFWEFGSVGVTRTIVGVSISLRHDDISFVLYRSMC